MDTATQMAFEGTKEQQELAGRAFEVMKRKGVLFAASAPIKMTVDAITKALVKEGGPNAGEDPASLSPRIEAALAKNKAVFARGDNGEFITTKAGRAYHAEKTENVHTFKQRINTEATTLGADEAKEYAASLISRTASRAEKSSTIVDTIVEIQAPATTRPSYTPLPARSTEHQTIIPQHLIPQPPVVEEEPEAPAPERQQDAAPVAATTADVPTRARPIEEAPVVTAPVTPVTPVTPARRPTTPPTEAAAPQPAVAAPTPVEEAPPARTTPAPAPTPVVEQPAVAAPASFAPTPGRARPTTPPPVVTPVVTGPVEVRMPTDDGLLTVDINRPLDEVLADVALENALMAIIDRAVESDARLIRFGSEIFPEEAVERFSKGDFRRIKEYLDEPETGGVASDRDIMAEVLNRRTDHPDYERVRFSINYRMLKEKKDFEFVGIDTDRLWIPAGVSPVVPPSRKPAEIGQDYRFLEDPAIAWVEDEVGAGDQAGGPLEYSLTYYEYENGVLPYDRRFKRIFPGAIFEDQRASLLRFEIPQLYGALLAELRYSTGNRGGFIMGLNELFTEHMVPGARFTIVPTDRGEDVFEIHFTRADEVEASLLQFDERRSRYVFRPVSYAIETNPAMLLTQEKFGKLHNHKKLEESERKRADVVIANAFEVVGEDNDGKLWAAFDDLYPVVNIERPISPSWLRTMLSGAYPFFYADENLEGAYFYDRSKRPS